MKSMALPILIVFSHRPHFCPQLFDCNNMLCMQQLSRQDTPRAPIIDSTDRSKFLGREARDGILVAGNCLNVGSWRRTLSKWSP